MNDEGFAEIRTFQVSYSFHRRRDGVRAATALDAAQQIRDSITAQFGPKALDDLTIHTVIEHGIDPERACEACEARWAHNPDKPEPPTPPRGAPPTGGPTGGTHPTRLQEAA